MAGYKRKKGKKLPQVVFPESSLPPDSPYSCASETDSTKTHIESIGKDGHIIEENFRGEDDKALANHHGGINKKGQLPGLDDAASSFSWHYSRPFSSAKETSIWESPVEIETKRSLQALREQSKSLTDRLAKIESMITSLMMMPQFQARLLQYNQASYYTGFPVMPPTVVASVNQGQNQPSDSNSVDDNVDDDAGDC